jgi:hypothetical protein
MKKTGIQLFIAVSAICIFCVVRALAGDIYDGGQNPGAVRDNGLCAQDREEFCPDLKGQALQRCMISFMDQLSPACRERISQTAQQRAKRNPCRQDIESYCSGITPGGGRIIQCLKANVAQLSSQCKDAVANIQKEGK